MDKDFKKRMTGLAQQQKDEGAPIEHAHRLVEQACGVEQQEYHDGGPELVKEVYRDAEPEVAEEPAAKKKPGKK